MTLSMPSVGEPNTAHSFQQITARSIAGLSDYAIDTLAAGAIGRKNRELKIFLGNV